LPHLSDLKISKPDLKTSERAHAKGHCLGLGSCPTTRFRDTQEAVTSTPVLHYYNLKEEIALQCDISQMAALMQNGQLVAYASKALISAETQYAQIEKELLAIVFACDHFKAYIYRRERVQVETDHKPLVFIVFKPLDQQAPNLTRTTILGVIKALKVTFA